MGKKVDRCQANQRSLVLIRAVRTLQMVVTVRSISRRSTVIMRSTAGIKQRRKDTVVHGRGSVTSRDKATKKRYGRAWKRIRDKYAAEHPFCELCFERGIIVPTEEIHHKKPLSEGGTHDRSNLIALCKSCHSTIHAKRGDYWGNHRG